jgi:DNA-binding NarL/FixJ family response regulator
MEKRAVAEYKVFLVEDSPMLRTRVEAMLGSIPGAAMVGHADGAQQAIEAILAARPDAVVLDLHLKEGNGFDVLRAVSKSAPHIAFYVLTNHPAEGYRLAAERLGARGFFDKSHEFERLREALAAAAAKA